MMQFIFFVEQEKVSVKRIVLKQWGTYVIAFRYKEQCHPHYLRFTRTSCCNKYNQKRGLEKKEHSLGIVSV